MKLNIITPDSTVYTADNIFLIQLPGISGSFEIMNNHAPMISVLKEGQVKVVIKGENPRFFDIHGGVIEVMNNKVLILAE